MTTCKPLPPIKPEDIKRFWSKVNKKPGQGPNGDCWEWTGNTYDSGYGEFWLAGKNVRASRIAYFLAYKKDPFPDLVLHSCDNPPCCRSTHFFIGSATDNMQDASKKGRMASGDDHWSRSHPEKVHRGENHWTVKHPEMVPRGDRSGTHTHPESYAHLYKISPEQKITILNEFSNLHNTSMSLRGLSTKYGITHSALNYIAKNGVSNHIISQETYDKVMTAKRDKTGNNNASRRLPERLKRGSENPASKLTEEKVISIKKLFRETPGITKAEIARRFGINPATVWQIVTGITWIGVGDQL